MNGPMLFLGGTCAGVDWRKDLIPQLQEAEIEYFNPVVEDWNAEARKKEDEIKNHPDTYNLFYITAGMEGVYSIAEVLESAWTKPDKTFFGFDAEDMSIKQLTSLYAVADLLAKKGVHVIASFEPMIKKLVEGRMDLFLGCSDVKERPRVLQFFEYAHLPAHLQKISRPFCELALKMHHEMDWNPELLKCLDKLLEAKDAAVRAYILDNA